MAKKTRAARAAVTRKFQGGQLTMFNRVAAAINAVGDTGTQACLEATFGLGGSLNCLFGSNGVERGNIARRLAQKASVLAATSGFEMALVTVSDRTWEFDQSASVLDLPLIRRANNALKKLSVFSIGSIKTGCLPQAGGGFRYVPVVQAAIFGRDLQHWVPAAAAKLQKRWQSGPPFDQPIQFRWLEDRNALQSFTELMRLFSMADPLRSVALELVGSDKGSKAAWKAARVERHIGRYQVLSMSPLDRLLMATGELAPILSGALAEAANRTRKLYSVGPKPLHRDQIPHFWFGQQLRRNDLILPPFIKTS